MQVAVACVLLALLAAASFAEASEQSLSGRKLAQSKPEWKSSECVSFGDAKLKNGKDEMHPHDYCDKEGGVKVCCSPVEPTCGGATTCRGGNRQACCPKK